jgi:hypothetical protein
MISNAHITQEWKKLIATTAMTENKIFLQHKLTLHICYKNNTRTQQ